MSRRTYSGTINRNAAEVARASKKLDVLIDKFMVIHFNLKISYEIDFDTDKVIDYEFVDRDGFSLDDFSHKIFDVEEVIPIGWPVTKQEVIDFFDSF